MSLWVLGGLAFGVWAMLSIVGNEHVRRSRELEKKYALPPLPPQPLEIDDADDDTVVVHEAKPH